MPDASDQVQFDCTCSLCGSTLPVGARFCRQCGGQAIERAVAVRANAARHAEDLPGCPSCGAPGDPAAKYCGACGAALSQSISRARQEPDVEQLLAHPVKSRMSPPPQDNLERPVEHVAAAVPHPVHPEVVSEALRERDPAVYSDSDLTAQRADPSEPVISHRGRWDSREAAPAGGLDRTRDRGSHRVGAWLVGLALMGAVAIALVVFLSATSPPDSTALAHPLDPAAVQRVVMTLRQNAPAELYPLLATNATRGYRSPQAFIADYRRQLASSGPITYVAASGPMRSRTTTSGTGLGSLILRIGYGGQSPQRYKAYFVLERGGWRLWFTSKCVDSLRGALRC